MLGEVRWYCISRSFYVTFREQRKGSVAQVLTDRFYQGGYHHSPRTQRQHVVQVNYQTPLQAHMKSITEPKVSLQFPGVGLVNLMHVEAGHICTRKEGGKPQRKALARIKQHGSLPMHQ